MKIIKKLQRRAGAALARRGERRSVGRGWGVGETHYFVEHNTFS